jgi:hypothetical protein
MSAQLQNIVNEFVMMWVLIDPVGTVPVFLLATRGMRPAPIALRRRRPSKPRPRRSTARSDRRFEVRSRLRDPEHAN